MGFFVSYCKGFLHFQTELSSDPLKFSHLTWVVLCEEKKILNRCYTGHQLRELHNGNTCETELNVKFVAKDFLSFAFEEIAKKVFSEDF